MGLGPTALLHKQASTAVDFSAVDALLVAGSRCTEPVSCRCELFFLSQVPPAACVVQVHERCRDNVETAFSHLTITLSTCLVEHRMEFEESVARRRAAAFTVMAIIYYLDMHKSALDSIHESLVGRREDSPPARCFLSCFRPNVESLGVD